MPLTKLLSSEARNVAALAISSEQNIKAPFFGSDRFKKNVQIRKVADVTVDGGYIGLSYRFERFIQISSATTGDENVGSFGDECFFVVARPIPLVPPVTRAIFPESFEVGEFACITDER
jgi:hypothetical protein